MINMKDLIKKQTDMIREESGMNIKEELNEWTMDADTAGEVLVDVSDELAYYIKKAKNRKKWGKKYFKNASKMIHDIRAMIIVFQRM